MGSFDERVRTEVERRAKALGVWRDGSAEVNRLGMHIDGGCCEKHSTHNLRIWHRFAPQTSAPTEPLGFGVAYLGEVIPLAALLVLMVEATGRTVRRRCSDCAGGRQRSADDCLACTAKGYVEVPLARVVCEARSCDCLACGSQGKVEPGDPTARTELALAAYGLAVGWTDEERATQGCRPGLDPEPDEAGVLRDWLEARGAHPEAVTLEELAGFETPPATEAGRLWLLCLSGAPCETCEWEVEAVTDMSRRPFAKRGHGWVLALDADKIPHTTAEASPGEYLRLNRCPACEGHGTAYAAQVRAILDNALQEAAE